MLLCSNALFVIPAQAGPGLGSGSHIEAQIGTQFSALGSHCRFLACVEDAQRLRLPSAPLPGGGLPVCTGPDLRPRQGQCDPQRPAYQAITSSIGRGVHPSTDSQTEQACNHDHHLHSAPHWGMRRCRPTQLTCKKRTFVLAIT